MNRIAHISEPSRLLLVWQGPMSSGRRDRRIVGELVRNGESIVFRYLTQSEDFSAARGEGFVGFPAFKVDQVAHPQGVMDAFMRRLPPRSRDDFDEYVARHRLPFPFPGSDFALLAYTGARLPSDGFELVADWTSMTPPLELVTEVAGFRRQTDVGADQLRVGDEVRLLRETDNAHDRQAIAIHHRAGRLGYLPRPYCAAARHWIDRDQVRAVIDRLNGTAERPVVYLFVTVLAPTAQAA